MGLADAFGKEETVNIKVSEFCRLAKSEEREEIIRNALSAGIPLEITRMLFTGESPELREYKETGLTPEKIREMDKLYLQKCEELNEAVRQLTTKIEEKTAAENDAAEKAGEIEKLEGELKAAWDDIALLKKEQQEMIAELNRLRSQQEETARAEEPAAAEGDQKAGKETKKKAAKKAPEKQKAQEKREPLDMGKVKALREAGWSLKNIGEEMGCSPQTIANALNREGWGKEETDV